MEQDYSYSAPVDKLLTYRECEWNKEWDDYSEFGFTNKDAPELIRMALDQDLTWADSESTEVWAPVHAWRALGQLQAEEAIEPLLNLFHEADDENDWVGEDLPKMYAKMGAKALPALANYLADLSRPARSRTRAAYALELMPSEHPDTRAECVAALTKQLAKFSENESDTNAFFIGHLEGLDAVEAIDVIREAYEKECVDYPIGGDIEEVEITLGLRKERLTPVDYPTLQDEYPYFKEMREQLLREEKKKIGRNDPCPCGSGKKYKKCCLNKQKDPTIREFLSMDSKRQIVFADASEKQELLSLLRRGKIIPATKKVQEKTGADERFVKKYIKRLREQIRNESQAYD